MEEQLRVVFERFSTFGNRPGKDGEILMDSRACQKLAKDCGVTGKQLTPTDIDLIFTKVKPMGERKITFDHFIECTRYWAVKLNKSHAEVVVKIVGSSGPKVNTSVGVTPNISPKSVNAAPKKTSSSPPTPPGQALPRLHPDWYEVENPNSTTSSDRFYYVNRLTNETSWSVPYLVPPSTLVPPPPPSEKPASGSSGSAPPPRTLSGQDMKKMYPSTQGPQSDKEKARSAGRRRASLRNISGGSSFSEKSSSQSKEEETKHNNIFDRLTDPSLYTGSHKHRFDPETGKGRGLKGRDSAGKGTGHTPKQPKSSFKGHTNTNSNETVHNIAHVLRPNLA